MGVQLCSENFSKSILYRVATKIGVTFLYVAKEKKFEDRKNIFKMATSNSILSLFLTTVHVTVDLKL
jgi:hypothetical protein